MPLFLAEEACALFHKVVALFNCHSVDVHGIWIFGFVASPGLAVASERVSLSSVWEGERLCHPVIGVVLNGALVPVLYGSQYCFCIEDPVGKFRVQGSLEHPYEVNVIRGHGQSEVCLSDQEFEFGDQFFCGFLSLSKILESVGCISCLILLFKVSFKFGEEGPIGGEGEDMIRSDRIDVLPLPECCFFGVHEGEYERDLLCIVVVDIFVDF